MLCCIKWGSMKRAESSDDEDDDSKQVAIVQNHMSWEEDLQLAISELSTIKRTMSIIVPVQWIQKHCSWRYLNPAMRQSS